MNNVVNYSLQEAYLSMKSMDKLAKNYPRIDQESLRPIVKKLFRNDTGKGERPHIDETATIKTLFLQIMYNLLDESMEREIHGRISFRNFLHYPEIMHDSGY
ncbi:MAG: transposase [Thermoplasmataceae archaeon]